MKNCADWLAPAYVANVPLGLRVPTLCILELGAGFSLCSQRAAPASAASKRAVPFDRLRTG